VHFGIGAVVVLAFGLSAVPEILAESRRIPSRIDPVLAVAEEDGLWVAFAVQDQSGRDMAVSGTADVRVYSTGLDPLPQAQSIAALARYRVDVPRDRYADIGLASGHKVLCRLEGIPYNSSRGLQQAARTYQFIRVEIVFTPHTGTPLLGRGEPIPIGDPGSLFPPSPW
jgi:hypothetical protein